MQTHEITKTRPVTFVSMRNALKTSTSLTVPLMVAQTAKFMTVFKKSWCVKKPVAKPKRSHHKKKAHV